MECIYFVHPYKYDADGGTFISTTFTNNRGSFSMVGVECANGQSGSVCTYADQHCAGWRKIVSDPAVFLRIPSAETLHPNGRVETTGAGKAKNPCHVEVFDVEDDEWQQVFESIDISDLEICDGGTSRQITTTEFFEIKARYESNLK